MVTPCLITFVGTLKRGSSWKRLSMAGYATGSRLGLGRHVGNRRTEDLVLSALDPLGSIAYRFLESASEALIAYLQSGSCGYQTKAEVNASAVFSFPDVLAHPSCASRVLSKGPWNVVSRSSDQRLQRGLRCHDWWQSKIKL